MTLDGKVVIVTGAARGIGQEYAQACAKVGARVVATDINDCGETLDSVRAVGGDAIAVKVDVSDCRATDAMVAAALKAFDRVDGLINNAALYAKLRGGRFDAISEADWDATMAVNVKGIWNCCKSAVPAMRKTGGGSIVNIASLAATYGLAYAIHYTTSKAAVIGMTRGLARELGRENIRVNAIAPSAVLTEGTQEFFGAKHAKALQAIAASQSIPRNLVPSDLAGTAIWLLSGDSGFVTGQTISVDGGTVMN
ncbi:glucose 1-dehydrogenase [Bradyrhizobium sp.]|uniref:SDR family NAD(P)-dependent oxidoreductase n=1 Tax=Bradyrhizobium sp. TaxID=376 RepID=UPI0025C071EA|nr:glucose 1-dehydrogenase [Bradyrhizobium sp.]